MNLGELKISSPAFKSLEHLSKHFIKDGDNVSPPLEWNSAPKDTKEFALICHDPDAPHPNGFTHWVVYGIPPEVTHIAEGDGKEFTLGKNSFGEKSYGGPAPPPGHGPHHYYFWLYALDKALNLSPGLTREELLEAIADHILEQARIVGIYELK